jgi:GcrA cell cycle regulator
MRGKQDLWTKQDVALLQALWREGATASAIAAQLGVSRSSILGKIGRLRRLAASVAPSIARKSNAADEFASRCSPAPSPAHRRPGKRGDRSESRRAKAKARGKQLPELTNNCCRWPLGTPGTAKFVFCGVAEANLELGIAYCRRHRARAYLKPGRDGKKKKLNLTLAGEVTSVLPNPAASRASP